MPIKVQIKKLKLFELLFDFFIHFLIGNQYQILSRLLHVLTKNLIYDIIFYKSELNLLKED